MTHEVDFEERVRIDKWLWAARFFKTRSLAARAIDGGQIRLNGVRTKPAKDVRIDDVIEIRQASGTWIVRIRLLSSIRRSAGIAQSLYAETEASRQARQELRERDRLYREPAVALKGRPTKRDRRLLTRIGGD